MRESERALCRFHDRREIARVEVGRQECSSVGWRLASFAVEWSMRQSRTLTRARHVFRALTLLVLAAPAFAQRATGIFVGDSAVLAMIRQRVDEKRSAGIVVGVLDPEGHTRSSPRAIPARPPPLDGNTVFEIGSITKVFTATVLAALAEEGKVRLDDPVQKYLPASFAMPTRNGKPITLGTARRAAIRDCRACPATSARPIQRIRTPTTAVGRCTTSCRATS